jgi:hypothetical protein
MTDAKKPTPVTRAELYPLLGSVYLLIAFAFLGLVSSDDQNVVRVIGYLLFFGVALASSVTYSILGLLQRRRSTRESRDPAEPPAAADGGRHPGP